MAIRLHFCCLFLALHTSLAFGASPEEIRAAETIEHADKPSQHTVVASTLNRRALADNQLIHYGFNVDTPAELAELLPQLGRLAPGRAVKIVWVDPEGATDSRTLGFLHQHSPEGAQIEVINFVTDSEESKMVRANAELAELAKQQPEMKEVVESLIEENTRRWSDYVNWKEKAKNFPAEIFSEETHKLDRAATRVAQAKTFLGVTIWLTTGLAIGSGFEQIALGSLAAASGATLDFLFQRYAEAWVDFKRNLRLPIVRSVGSFVWHSPRSIAKYLATLAAKMFAKPMARFNRANPWTKGFMVDQIVGTSVGAYFRQIRHMLEPSVGSPLSAEWLGSFFGSNLAPMLIASGGEMSASSLMEKGVISRGFRWAFLQAWGLTFWGRNMVVAIGLSTSAFGQGLLWSIVGVDALSKIGFIIADKFIAPTSEKAQRMSNLFPPGEGETLVVRIFSPRVSIEDRNSIQILNGISGVLDINGKSVNPAGEMTHAMTVDHFNQVTEGIQPDPEKLTRLQTFVRGTQDLMSRLFTQVKVGCQLMFRPRSQ